MEVFLSVAEELHFGRAAGRLHMAQPPVTRIIKQLEHELGVQLFLRSTRKVALTAAGAAMLEPAKRVLEAAQKARDAATAGHTGEIGTVKLAFSGASTDVLVGMLAREVRRSYPGIEVGLQSQDYALPALARILRNEVDMSLGRWDHVPAELSTRVIAQEHLVVAVPAAHPLAGRDGVYISDLAGEPLVALPPHEGSVLADRLRRLSMAAGFEPLIVQRAPDSWTAMALVAAEVGCHVTVSSIAPNLTDTHVRLVRVVDDILPIYLRLAWRPNAHNPAMTRVLKLAEKVWPLVESE